MTTPTRPTPHRCDIEWCEQTSRHPDDGHTCDLGYTPASLSTMSEIGSNGAAFPAVGIGVRFHHGEPGVYVHVAAQAWSIDVDVDLRPDEARKLADTLESALSLLTSATESTTHSP